MRVRSARYGTASIHSIRRALTKKSKASPPSLQPKQCQRFSLSKTTNEGSESVAVQLAAEIRLVAVTSSQL